MNLGLNAKTQRSRGASRPLYSLAALLLCVFALKSGRMKGKQVISNQWSSNPSDGQLRPFAFSPLHHALMAGKRVMVIATADEFWPWRNTGAQFARLDERSFAVVGTNAPKDDFFATANERT